MKRYVAIGFALLLLAPAAFYGWLVHSESGLRWAFRQGAGYLPGELAAERLEGTMHDRILLYGVDYRQDATRVRAERIELRWRPWALWAGRIDIVSLAVEGLALDLPAANAGGAGDDGDSSLPRVALPLAIELRSATLDRARLNRGERQFNFDRARLGGSLDGNRLRLAQLQLEAAEPLSENAGFTELVLRLEGEARLDGDYAHRLGATWQARLASGETSRNETRLEGNRKATEINHRASGPLQGRLALRLRTPFTNPGWQASAEVERFDTRRLDPDLPAASGSLELAAQGDGERAHIEALDLAVFGGRLSAQGEIDWTQALRWTMQLEASDIDPVSLAAEWPGRVNARLASSGRLDAQGIDAQAEVSEAGGSLRGYPFSASGRLHWIDDSLRIDAARVTSGATRVEANGRIGQVLDLDWSLRSEQLDELYPSASGRLNASGRLAGERSAPVIEARFDGSELALKDLRAARIEGELAADLQRWRQLRVRLEARDLDLHGRQLQTLALVGDQHRLDASLVAADLTATLALRGGLVENGWRGTLAEANIASAAYDDWRLQAPAALAYVDNRFELAQACLRSERQARVCTRLYNGGGESRVAASLTRVPLGLLRGWFANDIDIGGAVDAEADFSRRDGERLLGNLDARMSDAYVGFHLDDEPQRVDFDAVEFRLALDAEQASAVAQAQRGNGDRLQASLLLPGADLLELDPERQALRATLSIDARGWTLLDRMLSQVENLGGHLRADLDIGGTLAAPRLNGNAALDGGSIDIPEHGLAFEAVRANLRSERAQAASFELDAALNDGRIDLRARSSQPQLVDPLCLATSSEPGSCGNLLQAGESWDLQLTLARVPLRLLERWIERDLAFDGVVDASGDLEYRIPGRLLGTLDASLPAAAASFAYDAGPQRRTERLEYRQGGLRLTLDSDAARVGANLLLQNGDRLEARIVMPGADPLALDLRRQPLDGEVSIDARDWTLLDAMLPQVLNLQGILRAELEIDGSLGAPRVRGEATVQQGRIDLPDARLRLERINLRAWSDGADLLRYEADAVTAGGSVAVGGNTRLDRDAGWETRIELDGDDLDIATLIAQWVEQPLRIDGRMRAQANLNYRAPDRLVGNIRLDSATGELAYPLLEREPERWRYRDASLVLELGEQGIAARSALRVGNDNRLEAALDLPGAKLLALDAARQQLDGNASLYFTELGLVQHLLPEVDRMQGELALDLDLAGKLASPLLRADARMQGASFTIPRLGLQIDGVSLSGRSDAQNRFHFELTAESGDGNLSISGSSLLDAARGWPTRIQVGGENFEVSRIPEAHVNVSPDLSITIEGREILVEGDLLLPYARLQPRDVSTAARVSSDAVVIGMEQPAEERWLVTTRVNVILGDRVTFFGFGFEGKLGGRLRIDDAPGELSVGTGEILIPEGRYRAYGQRLDVENGRLLFTGSALDNPGLDVRAIRRVNDIVVGLQLRGRVKQPELELFSIPPMGQTDTLSYLILGRPMEGASESEGELVAKAALALGLAGGDTIARRLGDQFGFDEVRVESSDDGDQASLVVGRYLSPRLYVSYGVGLIESINLLRLRYELTQNWKVEAESGEDHGADLLFTIER